MSGRFGKIPPVTLTLIIVNLVIFAACVVMPDGGAITATFAVSPIKVMSGQVWTIITSMFLHSGLMHVACNMISLYYLGVMCERVFGSLKFAVLYFASGIAGNVVFVACGMMTGDLMTSAVGASGAVFGLFGAYGYLLIRERRRNVLFAMKPTSSDFGSYMAFLIINLAIGFAPGSGIANEAHIGGMICGFAIAAIMYELVVRKRRGGSR